MPRVEPVYEESSREQGPAGYAFECPACGVYHSLNVRPAHWAAGGNPVWSFNGDVERPTFSPSLLVRWNEGENREPRVCHSFVRDGRIQFLGDCTHDLAGQTVELLEVEEGGTP